MGMATKRLMIIEGSIEKMPSVLTSIQQVLKVDILPSHLS